MALAIAQPVIAGNVLRAQETERPDVMRALEPENAGKYREAAVLFRGAIRTAPSANELL